MTSYFKPVKCDHLSFENVAKVVAGVAVTLTAVYEIQMYRHKRLLSKRVTEKLNSFSGAKKKLQNHLNDVKKTEEVNTDIADLPFSELQQRLSDGRLDAVSVIRAYQQKALEVDRQLNCIIEPISEAEEWAKSSRRGSPLYGIPLSLKDTTPIQGYDWTLGGCANLVGMTHGVDAAFIEVLKKQGAVPFAITTAPQLLLSFACVSPMFGFTGNPHDPQRTPGGSSGGEGALIGGHGSLLGIGSDMGGSIRVPAAYCGICGLKPTHERFSYLGYFPIMQTAVAPTTGPLARDVDSIVAFMRALLVPELWERDPVTPPLPFRDEIYSETKPLRIGFYKDDGYVPSIPAYHRAINIVKEVLEKRGHTVIPFQVPDVHYGVDLGFQAVFGDGGQGMKQLLTGDKLGHDVIIPLWTLWLPKWLRRIYCWFDSFSDKARAASLRATCGSSTVPDWWSMVGKIQGYRNQVIKAWKKEHLDAVICPPSACVAMPDGVATRMGVFYSYTFLYNIVNFPAGVVPVTRVSPGDVDGLSQYRADSDGLRVLKQAMAGSEGLPVGVQCVGLPYQEELVMRLMKVVEDGVKSMRDT